MKPEIVKIGLLMEEAVLKKDGTPLLGKLSSKEKGKFRAFKRKNGDVIFFGSSIKDLTDEEVLKMKDNLIVGKIEKNFVVYPDSWTWE
jgi:hypothetical protein